MIALLRILILLFIIASALALSWRQRPASTTFQRSVSSSRSRTVSSTVSRSVPAFCLQAVSLPRLATTFLSSSSTDDLNEVKKEIRAVKHILKGGDSTKASNDILEFLPIYKGRNEDFLTSMLAKLQDKEMALILNKASVESKDSSNVITVTFKSSRNKKETRAMAKAAILFSSLCEVVREEFSEFEVSAFKLRFGDANGARIKTDQDLALHLTSAGRSLTIFIESDCKGFNSFTLKEALLYAGARGGFPIVNNDKFPSATYNDDDDTINSILDQAFREVLIRIPIFDPFERTQSETTVRELITPVLVAAARIAKDVRLVCEKSIDGSRGNGPVDYVAEYKKFNAVITEAKKDSVDTGLSQNIAQLVSSREDYIHNVLGVKLKIDDAAHDISSVPSFGVVSTAEKWIFTLYEGSTVYCSSMFLVSLSLTGRNEHGADLRSSLYEVIRQLVGVLDAQMESVNKNDITRTTGGHYCERKTNTSSSSVSSSS